MKFKNFILPFILFFFFSSCKVTFTPASNPAMIAMVSQASQSSDNLYNGIITSSSKTYAPHAAEYADIDNQIDNIVQVDSVRSKAKVILIIVNDIKNRFAKYEADHKTRSLNVAELKSYRDYMHALWQSLYNTEINLKP